MMETLEYKGEREKKLVQKIMHEKDRVARLEAECKNLELRLQELHDALEDEKKDVWMRAWTAVVQGDPSVTRFAVSTAWADKCLEAYKERFK